MERKKKLNNDFLENLIGSSKELVAESDDVEMIISQLKQLGDAGENVKVKYGDKWLYSIFAEDENYIIATGFDKTAYLKIKKSEANKPLQKIVDFHRVWEKLYKKHIKDKFEDDAYREIEEYINSVISTYDLNQIQELSIDMMHLAELMRFAKKGNLVENAERFKRIAKTPEQRLFHLVTYFIITSNARSDFDRAFMEDVYEIYGSKDKRFVREIVDEYAQATKLRLFGEGGQNAPENNKQKI